MTTTNNSQGQDLPTRLVDVLVIGGGPSGLSAAAQLASSVESVLVLDREAHAGGIPRHSDHPGYGLRDKRTFVSGPAYAKRLVKEALAAGAEIMTGAAVTNWDGERAVVVTSPAGRIRIEAKAIVLATGARERARAARRIPGDRPHGVLTTGQLQNLVHVHHRPVGSSAVVVGSELVSWSAVMTLREAGCRTVMLTSEKPRGEAYWFFSFFGKIFFRTMLAKDTRVVSVMGKPRVTGVEIENTKTGQRRVVACDTVVFTGDWIPDHELAVMGGLAMNKATLGPEVDTSFRTSAKGVFAVGNMLHPVETADVAALDGRGVAPYVIGYLTKGGWPQTRESVAGGIGVGVEIACDEARWVFPTVIDPAGTAPARGKILLWPNEFVAFPTVTAEQDGVVVGRKRIWYPCSPGRVFRVPASILAKADVAGGPVQLKIG